MSKRFEIIHTPLSGLVILNRLLISDNRGYFERMMCINDLESLLDGKIIEQINHTKTFKSGTVRGLHFQQPPFAERKFVSCLYGKVYDVAVDIRKGSPTFLHWYGVMLSEHNHKTMVIPEGFAHGFQALADNCEMVYFHTATYHPEAEGAINALDPKLDIQWPLQISTQSNRDLKHHFLTDNFNGLDQ